ncbi:MAG: efflux RND transporter periplasmic adaptor subunit [Candidatus Aminicenantes bacterium]|nr:MAG: efflux RND transporter periplasmic adaptor subunit [Candidatus Aminicenantes bacterium]
MGMDKKIEKKKWPPKRIIKYSAIAAFILVVGYLIIFGTGGSSLNVKIERITISTVEKGPFQEYIPIIGNVLPLYIQYLSASEGGIVEEIFIEAGSQVKKGDKILKLSNTNLLMTLLNNDAQINRASNDLRATRLQLEQNRLLLKQQRSEAEYYLDNFKRTYERNKVLYDQQLISKKEFEDSKADYEYWAEKHRLTIESQEKDLQFREEQVKHLEASVKRMQDNLDIVKQQLENLTIRAPISGYLTSLPLEVGQSKNRGDTLGQIDDIEGFRVRAEIDEHYINRVATGKVGHFNLTGRTETYELEVQKIYPEVEEGKFRVDLVFTEKQPKEITRGQSLHIRLQLSEASKAILLARGGFYQTTGGNWAYVLNDSGSFAVKKSIRLGRQNPQFFEVLEGLNPGEEVITSSYENFGDMERLILK